MDSRRPRIFIGIPAYGQVDPEVLADYMRFAFHLGRRMPAYDFFIGIRSKAEQFRARNQIVDAATQVDADYVLMLDDDMLIDFNQESGVSNAYGFLEQLIAHNKDVIGGLYYQKTGECQPVAMLRSTERGYRFLREDELVHGLQQVDVAGGGCLLIKMKVFNHLAFPYFGPEFEFGTDVQLCRKAAEKGFTIWLDSSFEFGHVRAEKTIVTSRTRLSVQVSSVPGEVRKHFAGREVYEDLLKDAAVFTGYPDLDAMTAVAREFLDMHAIHEAAGLSDVEWYRQYPKERIARQVWFNTLGKHKREMTEAILNGVDHTKQYEVLDFGCGIGIPAYEFAKRGHRVTACDIEGTGTFEFLQWRAKERALEMTFHGSRGDVPHLGDAMYDVIVAMDSLEHITAWPLVLRELVAHLRPSGVLFCNNGVLDDHTHPEHKTSMTPAAFGHEILDLGLMQINPITYVVRPKVAELETRKRVSLTGSHA